MDYRPSGLCNRLEFLLYEHYEFGLHESDPTGWAELEFYMKQITAKIPPRERVLVNRLMATRLGQTGRRPNESEFRWLVNTVRTSCRRLNPFHTEEEDQKHPEDDPPEHTEEEDEKRNRDQFDCGLLLNQFDMHHNNLLSVEQAAELQRKIDQFVIPDNVGTSRYRQLRSVMEKLNGAVPVDYRTFAIARDTIEFACRMILPPDERPTDLCEKIDEMLREAYSVGLEEKD